MNITNSQIVYNIRFSDSEIVAPGSDAYVWIFQNGYFRRDGRFIRNKTFNRN